MKRPGDGPGRTGWLDEVRSTVRDTYDGLARDYDIHPYPTRSHASFVDRLLETCPPDGLLLDAPCGTGRYFAHIAASGRRVVGADQSSGMLEQARRTGIATELHQVALQELAFDGRFDGAVTIDAMENVPPEDWPRVLANLRRAVRPGAHLYVTVEESSEAEIDAASGALRARGLPAVRGEVTEGDVAGYHYYPGREQVVRWLDDAGLSVVEEGFAQEPAGATATSFCRPDALPRRGAGAVGRRGRQREPVAGRVSQEAFVGLARVPYRFERETALAGSRSGHRQPPHGFLPASECPLHLVRHVTGSPLRPRSHPRRCSGHECAGRAATAHPAFYVSRCS